MIVIPRAMRHFPAPALLALVIAGCGRPPQIGDDKDSYKAVDALYTAVSLRDSRELNKCAARLKVLSDGNKLPESAARSLESIVAEAKDGDWDSARQRLATFMRGQRR
jgi:hypothetical protein